MFRKNKKVIGLESTSIVHITLDSLEGEYINVTTTVTRDGVETDHGHLKLLIMDSVRFTLVTKFVDVV